MFDLRRFIQSIFMFVMIVPLILSTGWAQNVRVQSGIIAATSGLVRVVSADIGRIAETGQEVYLNDIVETGNGGKMQIMLMDRTTLTIGPNTSLVIDEFVFDPGVERTLSATVLKGTFKLASPTLFNNGSESREIKLPNAVVAIRGTELIGSISDDVQNVVLLNGAITVANNDFIQDIDRPNFGVSISETGEISPPEFFSSDDLGVLLNQLDGDTASNTDEADETESDEASEDQEETTEENVASKNEENDAEDSNEATEPGITTTAEGETENAPVLSAPVNEGPEPTEAEVVAAAEAVADGSADITDLQVLSRAGPQNIQAVANVLGVQFDEETGDITPESEAFIAPTINSIIAENGIARGDVGENGFEIPELSLNFGGEGNTNAPQFNFTFNREDSFAVSNGFNSEPIGGEAISLGGFESRQFNTEFSQEAFFAPVIEFDPAAFEGLAEFTSFEAGAEIFFEPQAFYISPANVEFNFNREEESNGFEESPETFDESFEGFEENLSSSLDNLVTEALEEVINEISLDISSTLPEGTYMPNSASYRSWNGSEWNTIAQNFNSGVVRFEHANVLASFHSGSYCQDCEAVISSMVTIDFNAMNYNFDGSGVFIKPGYHGVEFSASTPLIPLNYWELSSGSIYRLSNERELESIYDDPEIYTLTSTTDADETIDATIDLDFLYDTQLSDNNDLNSNIGVFGHSRVEYTETGESEVTFKTSTEAMQPVSD